MENFNQVHSQWSNIPEELRMRNNWCISGPDKVPMYHDREGQLVRADVTNPATWMSFDYACELVEMLPQYDAGFVLQAGAGLACIDLDVVNEQTQLAKGKPVDASQWTTQADLERYWSIAQHFNSYTESSRSGQGLHIWVLGEIGKGCRCDGIEVYSQERYIICMGNVVIASPIQPRQEILTAMVGDMRAAVSTPQIELEELEPKESDDDIWKRAARARNADKFLSLCNGLWKPLGYPSQSEADFALIAILAFHSHSNEQCRRLFRITKLGRRYKATKDSRYLDSMLIKIRSRQKEENAANREATEHGRQIAQKLIESFEQKNKLKSPSGDGGKEGI